MEKLKKKIAKKAKSLKSAKSTISTKGSKSSKILKSLDPFQYVSFPEEEEHEHEISLEPALSRTSLLIQDYLNFKNAVILQTALRGWYTRLYMEKSHKAAIVIQTVWRSFYAKRYYFCLLETTLQKRVEEHFEEAATRIQALWRGYWVREHVHNQQRLMRMQVFAAEDLLYCVAFKLHHLLRTYSIPGVFSLKDSNCLSRVEKLLKSMTFKEHNRRKLLEKQRKEQEEKLAKKNHENAKFQTKTPFAGKNREKLCEPPCEQIYCEKDAEERMHRILKEYEDAFNRDPLIEAVKNRKVSRKLARRIMLATQMGDFCGDVIKAMKKWKILNEKKMKITREVFRDPQNVENFLSEADSRLQILKEDCCCGIYKRKKICVSEEDELCAEPDDQRVCP